MGCDGRLLHYNGDLPYELGFTCYGCGNPVSPVFDHQDCTEERLDGTVTLHVNLFIPDGVEYEPR